MDEEVFDFLAQPNKAKQERSKQGLCLKKGAKE